MIGFHWDSVQYLDSNLVKYPVLQFAAHLSLPMTSYLNKFM